MHVNFNLIFPDIYLQCNSGIDALLVRLYRTASSLRTIFTGSHFMSPSPSNIETLLKRLIKFNWTEEFLLRRLSVL